MQMAALPDIDPQETQEWLEALDGVLDVEGPQRAHYILEKLIEKAPEQAIELAVKGMLPKNPLGRAMARKLKVYSGGEHPHAAQQPQALEI